MPQRRRSRRIKRLQSAAKKESIPESKSQLEQVGSQVGVEDESSCEQNHTNGDGYHRMRLDQSETFGRVNLIRLDEQVDIDAELHSSITSQISRTSSVSTLYEFSLRLSSDDESTESITETSSRSTEPNDTAPRRGPGPKRSKTGVKRVDHLLLANAGNAQELDISSPAVSKSKKTNVRPRESSCTRTLSNPLSREYRRNQIRSSMSDPLSREYRRNQIRSSMSDDEIIDVVTIQPDISIIKQEDEVIIIENPLRNIDSSRTISKTRFQIKVFVKNLTNASDEDIEIRKFEARLNGPLILHQLHVKIRSIFPNLVGKNFTLQWKDSKGDMITVSSREELVIALRDMQNDAELAFYVRVLKSTTTEEIYIDRDQPTV
ncbi:hypothetical protein QAD02_001219 [Eretmocerus hayati]|uniref:Uncharacterized protein n=1 Tax=Eretmocerus hayati TaxID=131215 RepID=A0ACC2NK70_9HYME|nr:hypothetical protein QAD02_001219 [Eretmocerus hayati]